MSRERPLAFYCGLWWALRLELLIVALVLIFCWLLAAHARPWVMVRAAGLEPATVGLEIRCSDPSELRPRSSEGYRFASALAFCSRGPALAQAHPRSIDFTARELRAECPRGYFMVSAADVPLCSWRRI